MTAVRSGDKNRLVTNTAEIPNPVVEAVRIWHGQTPKVHITIDGRPQKPVGGARAARCQFVVIHSYADDNGTSDDGREGFGRRVAGLSRFEGLRSKPVDQLVNKIAYGYRQHYAVRSFSITDAGS